MKHGYFILSSLISISCLGETGNDAKSKQLEEMCRLKKQMLEEQNEWNHSSSQPLNQPWRKQREKLDKQNEKKDQPALSFEKKGVHFQDSYTLNQVLNKAKNDNKLTFIECYTTWCGPCKRLEANVFPNDTVSNFFNNNFVNGRFDMEKGEGLEIAKRYEIRSFPTLLWLDGNGNIIYKVVGGLDVAGLVQNGNKAIGKSGGVAMLNQGDLSVKQQIENYVNTKLETWQKKGEFEKTTDYLIRVSDENRKKKIAGWQEEKIAELQKGELSVYNLSYFTLMDYDADNETFLLKGKDRNYIISVPTVYALKFKQNFSKAVISNLKLILTDVGFKLSEFTISTSGTGYYTWSHTSDNPYQQTAINYSFDKAEINLPTAQVSSKQNNIEVKQINVGRSDVDTEIPVGSITRKNTFVLIIGNEHYKNEIAVDYATNDAEIFKKYTEISLGVPAQNIHLVKDASYGEMLREIGWLSDVGKAYKQEAKLIFYYAGHGMPDESSKSSFLLPIDGSASLASTAVSLNDLYNKLAAGQTETVTVILDACFSGSARNGMLASGRGVIIKPKEESIPANMIVLSAVSGEQTAHPYKEKGHGLFTYYLLKKLKESNGKITYGTLSDRVTNEVIKQSIVTNNKVQNPEVKTGISMEGNWKEKQF